MERNVSFTIEMTNQKIIGSSLYSSTIEELIYKMPNMAHLKDCKSYKYQIFNQENLDCFGLANEDDLRGKTIFDLENIMGVRWLTNFANYMHACDVEVQRSGSSKIAGNSTFIEANGNAIVLSVVKIPIFNNVKEVDGILTVSINVTDNFGLEQLKNVYMKLYPDNYEANRMFMKYIGFYDGLEVNITNREMDCIIAFSQHRNNKRVAKYLNISHKTVENYVTSINSKLNSTSIVEVVEKITSIKPTHEILVSFHV